MQKRQAISSSSDDPKLLPQAMAESIKMQHAILESIVKRVEEKPADAKAPQASAQSIQADQAPQPDAQTQAQGDTQGGVQLNAEGECEAVALLQQRDLAGCLAVIRANGHQVVVVRGV